MLIKTISEVYYNNLTQSLFLNVFYVSVFSVGGSSRFAATHMRSMGNVLGSGVVMTNLSLINDVK